MKKKILSFLLSISAIASWGQDITDAVLFSAERPVGTARFTAMNGAFGALGGDMSAISENPASSSVFLMNKGAVSLSNDSYTNDAVFRNGYFSKKNNHVDLNQAGVVFVFNNYNAEATINKFALAVNYEKTNSLDNRYTAFGTNTNSIGNYFEQLANGVPLNLLRTQPGESVTDLYTYLGETDFSAEGYNNADLQNAFLGYQAYLFDPVEGEENVYASNITGNKFDQQYTYIATGLNGKFSANASLALKDKYYIGLNLNSHFINYERTTAFEENIDAPSVINNVYFKNTLKTLGAGFSFQLGGIAKLNDMFRVGVSYKSPVWYTISEETSQQIESYRSGQNINNNQVVVRPNVVNLYPDYRLRTPGEITGSLGVVFGKSGLISVDYSYKDYSNIHYGSSDGSAYYRTLNKLVEENLTPTSTVRVGGEYRILNWSLRAGFRYAESPYKESYFMDNLVSYSGGLGYDFGNIQLDFAYLFSDQSQHQYMRQTGFSDRVSIDNTSSSYVLTLRFGL